MQSSVSNQCDTKFYFISAVSELVHTTELKKETQGFCLLDFLTPF